MKLKSIVSIVVLVVALIVGSLFWPHTSTTTPPNEIAFTSTSVDYKNASYIIEGKKVSLVNGSAQTSILPGSASMSVTHYFGNDTNGDLTGNGSKDVAFILTQSEGGSATFYYVVAALQTSNGYEGTNAILLGDRIAPQSTQIENGEIVVNYADRKPTDPMTTQPSVGTTKYLRVENGVLVEVENH